METVSVGCRLPNGIRLEVGFSVSERGNGGAPFAMVRKSENYKSFLIKGTNQHLIVRDQTRKPIAVLPNQANREPYVNSVPKDFWDRWVKDNSDKNGKPTSWHLTSGNLFVIPKDDASTLKAAVVDAKATSAPIFEPLDPSKTMKLENNAISRREEEE
jgi:hypothetical protein